MNKLKRITALIVSIAVLIICMNVVSAEVELPEGAVKGLPEGLTAMDSICSSCQCYQ